MNEDQTICLCFHVSRRKVTQFIRVRQPRRVSQLAECFGAGTGCGWCRGALARLMTAADPDAETLPQDDQYRRDREQYRRGLPLADSAPTVDD